VKTQLLYPVALPLPRILLLKIKSDINIVIGLMPDESFAHHHPWVLFPMVFSAQHLYIFHSPVPNKISMQMTPGYLTDPSTLSAAH